MFDALRRMILPIILIVIVVFAAMIVLEWGMGITSRQTYEEANVAGIINGEEVPWAEYNRAYNSMYQAEAAGTDEELPESKQREIHQQAWRQLLHDHLLLQEAQKRNFSVSDEEVYALLRYNPPGELQQVPDFQTEGRFDYQKYFSAMANPQAASFWASLEPFARQTVLKQKVQATVISTVHVSEPEVRNYYLFNNEKVKVGVVNVEYRRFSPPPKYTQEDLQAYYEANRENYQIDKRAVLNLAIIEKEPLPMDWERSYEKAMAIYDSVTSGADFADMAVAYSEDKGSASSGGDLGWFPEGQMVPEFDKRVFAIQPGEISEPIRTKFGWHIIKLHDRKEEMETPPGKSEMELVKQAHASHILIKTTPGQETLDQAYRRLEAFLSSARSSGFFKAAEDHQIPVRPTEPFFYGRNIQYIGRDPKASDFAFTKEVGEISDIMENNSAFYVCQVADKLPAGAATYEEAQQKVERDYQQDLITGLCRDTAAAIYAAIQNGTDIKEAAQKYGEEYEVLDEFKRNDLVRELGRDPRAVGAAFSLTEPGQMTPPIDHKQGTAIIRLIERTTPDLTEFNAARDSVYGVVLSQKQQQLYGLWFEKLVSESDIVNNVERSLEEGGGI